MGAGRQARVGRPRAPGVHANSAPDRAVGSNPGADASEVMSSTSRSGPTKAQLVVRGAPAEMVPRRAPSAEWRRTPPEASPLLAQMRALFTPEDLEEIADSLPLGTSGLILLFEHRWAEDLKDAIGANGGFLVRRDVIPPEILAEVSAQLEAESA